MRLSDLERGWLDGSAGEGTRFCLELVVRMGDLFGAERLLPVSQAHVDACLYTNDAGLEFAQYRKYVPGDDTRRYGDTGVTFIYAP